MGKVYVSTDHDKTPGSKWYCFEEISRGVLIRPSTFPAATKNGIRIEWMLGNKTPRVITVKFGGIFTIDFDWLITCMDLYSSRVYEHTHVRVHYTYSWGLRYSMLRTYYIAAQKSPGIILGSVGNSNQLNHHHHES